MAPYDLTFANNLTGPGDLFYGVNGLTEGLLGIFVLTFFHMMILVISMKRYDDFRIANIIAFSCSTLFSPLLWAFGWIPFWISFIPATMLFISLIVSVTFKKD